ncbi:UDP-N-acetylmuramoyl-L-alanyl-D-glutamate--2,6-diaminopimelate ligase [Candidatus Blochmannia ocreatus (nom. nud.)]|uniref:UDP-N-acetylmuramoyl-L-alanyl-D-glutamate--2,6-diaminopimelate ligase n=1 Tax=Candidatus Blochmannia ocreatus (nom. nud.) TaxID=251538 RepID=A0ABY4STC2_9ENTR|nr:UDP-N-acetylmuramoyl-L-alanyl-D-glutamate--2,6-diaminopimelate ligase [Candidatus Blochmannia ocreatus]URJ25220.1 UDP-N-acetylmuramoyl-L-alanyl-D-glutamate--2,6-diaminopimelate ligase [Candidatus Blochmannia ocreatus]
MSYFSENFINYAFTGIQLDSRNVLPGNLFIAVKGDKTDGTLYIDCAINKGAPVILSESFNIINKTINFKSNSIPIINVTQLRKYISNIAGNFYRHPSRSLNVIGVTGTNGKTTTTYLLADWMRLLGEKTAIMGTLGNGTLDNILPSYNTTCSAVDVQKILAKFVKNNIKSVAMEISSHGLTQYRVDDLYFKAAVFTNISHDHLDYHNDISQYSLAKWRLFSELRVEKYIINADDSFGCHWLHYLPQAVAITIKNKLPDFWEGKWISVKKIFYHIASTEILFQSSWGTGILHSKLLGEFNVSNLLLALGTLLMLGYPLALLINTSFHLKPVCGRMEMFYSDKYPMVIVDYAHTPDALRKILIAIRKYHCRKKLWCVFGCGGDRDHDKRAKMGYIAQIYADSVIITNDNPRTEDPESIIHDILHHVRYSKKNKIITNRKLAVETTIKTAHPNDIILIAGKGHETYQIIGNNHLKYSDRNVVKKILKK